MDSYTTRRDRLATLIHDILGDQVDVVTDDQTELQTGRTSVLIVPPDLSWDTWSDPDAAWSIAVLSGMPWKQTEGLDSVYDLIDRLGQDQRINLRKAQPWTMDTTSGTVSGYLITLNPMDII